MNCQLSVNKGISNLTPQLTEDKIEFLKIQNIVLQYLKKEGLEPEELEKKRKIVLESPPFNWPLLPLASEVLSKQKVQLIRFLFDSYCLDSKCSPWQIWIIFVQDLLNAVSMKILDVKVMGICVKEVCDIGVYLSNVMLRIAVSSKQTHLQKEAYNTLSTKEIFPDVFRELEEIEDKIVEYKLKAIHCCNVSKNQYFTIKIPTLKKQFEQIFKKTEQVVRNFSHIQSIITTGFEVIGNPSLRQYFYGIEIGKLILEPKKISYSHENISKINSYIDVIKKSWEDVRKNNSLTAVPVFMINLNPIPSLEVMNSYNINGILNYIHTLKKYIFNLHTQNEAVTLVYFKSLYKKNTWQEIIDELSSIKPIYNFDIDKRNLNNEVSSDWISQLVACSSVANTQLMTLHRNYENVICKNIVPGYISFDDLCGRLVSNFKNIFTENLENVSVESFNHASDEVLDHIIKSFSKDLSEINKQFGSKINDHLPDREVIDFCIFRFTLLKDSLISGQTLLPFGNSVIFVSTRVLPAIKKAHTWLFKRLSVSLKSVDSKQLLEDREYLIERMKGLCFVKMKPLLELFVTIRDIHAILLDSQQCSEEFNKGMHLIPTEFANLLQPSEIEHLVDLYIQKGHCQLVSEEADEMVSIIESLSVDNKTSDNFEKQQIPLLESSGNQKNAIKILDTLESSRSFKVLKGEKLSKILKRLRELGAYHLREGKGSHSIWVHPNTSVTFTIVHGDNLSLGVSKKLEEWVNHEIFGRRVL